MPLWLLVGDEIRHFPTNFTAYRRDTDHEGDTCYNPYTTTDCGEQDCNHIGCALFAAQWNMDNKSCELGALVFTTFGAILAGVYLVKYYAPLVVIPPILWLYIFFKALQDRDKAFALDLKDMTEFAKQGTINGIPGRQIYCVKDGDDRMKADQVKYSLDPKCVKRRKKKRNFGKEYYEKSYPSLSVKQKNYYAPPNAGHEYFELYWPKK